MIILKASETADPKKVQIVKQIRRLNEDGSYTIGYEADDGTFKIENKDVLGNVKGTFGYIDQDGEIKRVTYTSSSDSTPVPVTTSTTPSTPTMIVRVNKTVSSTTRRPLPTVVYPTRGSYTTRGTVIQAIPRRRAHASSTRAPLTETTTESQKLEETTTNILSLYKPKVEEVKTRTQILKPMSATVKDDLITRQTTTKIPATVKPVYERVTEKDQESDANKANTIRRELSGTSPNPRMISLQQSVGDDSTDVYGSHLSMGTVRPLFTTTTPRPRLVPIHSLVAARQKIQQQYQDVPIQEQETTIEASTGRVFDQDHVLTTNAVPVVHIQPQRDPNDQVYQQPIYRRPPAAVHFRTREYLRDNPGAPVPIGNTRPFIQYEFQNKVLEPQYLKETPQHQQRSQASAEVTPNPYDPRPVTRIIPIPVDDRGVPLQGYQGRFVNPYQRPALFQPRYEPVDEMTSIAAPVSTRDLRRLLHILILRQNKLQALMDQMMPGPSLYRPETDYRYQRFQDDDRYDYRYDQYRQEYQGQSYENQYESQRYVPRRRYPRPYDTAGSSSNHIEEMPEYLPPEIREALLLKMLILAISPDFMPTVAPPTELTTAAPPRKQVRNIQILGEEGSMDDKRQQRH
ncbi:cuticular protein CPH [Spodoptera litura]|uniref:Cuticular protein CPH n=1 Tax=Spodoptera litura TaxID=69820 RepID=A0A4U7BC67_SPOLT|nr:cuticular protein CPH [Spodoptera litura]